MAQVILDKDLHVNFLAYVLSHEVKAVRFAGFQKSLRDEVGVRIKYDLHPTFKEKTVQEQIEQFLKEHEKRMQKNDTNFHWAESAKQEGTFNFTQLLACFSPIEYFVSNSFLIYFSVQRSDGRKFCG